MTRILLLALLILVAAQERPWTARAWDNGATRVESVDVEVWGLAELRESLQANPPTHGTVSFYIDGPCWRVTVWAGGRRWAWEDMRGCRRYWFPIWPQVVSRAAEARATSPPTPAHNQDQ